MHRPALPVASLVLLVVLAGCLGPVGGGTPMETPEGTVDDGSATATPYPDEMVPFPDGPKERPPLPAEVTATTAREYAVAHEYRFRYNELHEPGAEVGMSENSCSVEATNETGDGYAVTLRCTAYVNRPTDGEGTETVHADYPPWTVRYYVDGDSVLRTELD